MISYKDKTNLISGIFLFLFIHSLVFSFSGIFIVNKNTYLQSNTIVIPTLYFYDSFHFMVAWFGHKNTEPEKGEQKGSAILRDWFH